MRKHILFYKLVNNKYIFNREIILDKKISMNDAIKIAKSNAKKNLDGVDAYRIMKCNLLALNDDFIYLTPILELNKGMIYNNQLYKESDS